MSTGNQHQQIQPEAELLKIREALSDFFVCTSTSSVIEKLDTSIGVFKKQVKLTDEDVDHYLFLHSRIAMLLSTLEVAEMKLRYFQPTGNSPNN